MRRRLLILTAATVAACGGGSAPPGLSPVAAPAPPPAPPAWTPGPITLAQGQPFDLSKTLPPGVPSGGRFRIDGSGTQLPAGATLSAAGLLSIGTAQGGQVGGIVFAYDY